MKPYFRNVVRDELDSRFKIKVKGTETVYLINSVALEAIEKTAINLAAFNESIYYPFRPALLPNVRIGEPD